MRQLDETAKKALQNSKSFDTIPIKSGWLCCPQCNRKLMRMREDTRANSLPVYCRSCKLEIILDIDGGLCAKRLSP